jgi:hypothetical protein
MSEESKKVLAIDVGFGDVKVGYLVDGKVKDLFKDVNIIYKLPSDKDSELKYTGTEKNIVKIKDEYYMLGGSALNLPDTNLVTVDNFDALKAVTPILVNRYLAKYHDQVDILVVTISSAFLKQSGDYKKYISEEVPFPIDHILVVPQGPSAKVGLDNVGLDVEDPSHKESFQSYLGVDIGFNTIDVFTCIDGSVLPADVTGYPGDGIIRIANKIHDYIKDTYKKDFAISRVKQIIYDGKFTSRSETIDVKDVIQKEVSDYIKWLHEFLEEKYGNVMDTIANIVIFGGGAEVIRSQADLWSTMYSRDFVKLPVNSSEFYNTIGALFIGNR